MNQNRKQIISLLCVGSLLLHNGQSRADNWQDFGAGLAVVGVAAAAVGAIIWGCSQESNNGLLARAQKTYHGSAAYKSLAQKINSFHSSSHTFAEWELEEISLFISKNSSIDDFSRYINKSIDSLHQVNHDLCERVKKIQHSIDRHDINFYSDMQQLSQKIAHRIKRIHEVKSVLDYHKDYFKCFEYERAMHDRYHNEFITAMRQYDEYYTVGYDKKYAFEQTIKNAVYQAKSSYKYPYRAYLSMVTDDQKTMSRLFNSLSSRYPQRKQSVTWVMQTLSHIGNIIASSYELKEESLQKKRDEIEEERQRITEQQRRKEQELKTERKRLKKERKKMEKASEKYDCNHMHSHKSSVSIRWQE